MATVLTCGSSYSRCLLNLVGVDSMPLDFRYSNPARYTVETCLPTNVNWILTGILSSRGLPAAVEEIKASRDL
jgi:hypothetical protein